MAASPSARCRTHSSTLAGWFCEGCNSSLCPKCVAEESFSITRMETCCRCGERAVPLRLHRSHRSYASRLMDSWRFLATTFETAADVAPNAATAPQALARLCGERMQDPARAASVYRYIVHRYLNTDAARFAAQRLPPSA